MSTCKKTPTASRRRAAWGIAVVWLSLWPLAQAFGQCPPVTPPPGSIPEMEPNNEIWQAQPWPLGPPLSGEQSPSTGSDFFMLDGVPPEAGVLLTVQPDTFNPLLRIWGLQAGLPVLLAESDQQGWCEVEQAQVGGWDPCQSLQPIDAYYLEVAQSPMTPMLSGSYLATAQIVFMAVPQGDCCAYPISVGAFPYTDTQTTSTSFRDMGFNVSADVWYELVLGQGGVLTAQTCGAATTFDTMLRLIDDDCQTVLASNDDNVLCGPGSTRSRFTRAMTAGTYYVMVEGSGSATGTFQLDLSFTTCNAVVPGPGALVELEPNDEWPMAQPWPISQQLYGEQTSLGDSDFFLVLGPQAQDGLALTLEPDTFDPVVRVYAMTGGEPMLVAEANSGGTCEVETVSVAGWDPCTQLVPLQGWLVEVSQSQVGAPMHGNYLISGTVVSSNVPQGDCCAYPINVGALPYADTQNTSVGFRDQGFGPAPDAWYKLVLNSGGVLTAQTCGGQSNFDTMLRIIDDDCQTVLATNDNSIACGIGSTQSWLSTCVSAGTYYVVVEGSGYASGAFTLNLALRLSGEGASLMVGEWGYLAEEWHQRYTPLTSTLRLLASDPCGLIDHVVFRGQGQSGENVLLGVDWDGSDEPRATLPQPGPTGDGWFLDFDPAMLMNEAGPVTFNAELHGEDGTVTVVSLESWYSPNLDSEELVSGLEHWELIRDDHFTVQPGTVYPGTQISIELGVKNMSWSRDVPTESQRGVSDTACSPTAYAACLEWLDATYGTDVCGGLSGEDLIRALGGYMGTDVNQPGTMPDDELNGLQRWINDHGGGYTAHNEPQGTTSNMASQAESMGQDVVAALQFANGAWHMVTMSSFCNLPNPDGTVTVDFMDPWTGTTQAGSFNPQTGAFSGYGDGNASGQLEDVTYVCPAGAAPGNLDAARTDWLPFDGPVQVPVPLGDWWMRLTFLDPHGKVADRFAIVRRMAPESPMVEIELVNDAQAVSLHWAPVADAIGYRIYRNVDGFFDITFMAPWQETSNTFVLDSTAPGGARWCYLVTTVYEQ